jgi:nucleolin
MGKTKKDILRDEDEQNSDDEPTAQITEEFGTEGDGDDEEAVAAGGKRKRKRKRKKKSSSQDADAEVVEEDGVDEGKHSTKHMVQHTVYVEGIPFDATPDQVKDFFVKGGIDDVVELRLPTWQDSGRLRGYGHILFESEESFAKALTLSGQNLGKRYLTVQAANTPRDETGKLPLQEKSRDPPSPTCCTLFLSNLAYSASEDEISQAVEKLGVSIPQDGVRIARNSVTRQSKGFCYIDFETPDDAKKVMDSGHRLTVNGRLVRLDWDTGRMKGSYRTDTGRLWSREVKEKKRVKTGY